MKLFRIASVTVRYGITDSYMHRLWEGWRNLFAYLLVFHRSLRLFQSRSLRYLSRMNDRYVQLFVLFIFNASRDTKIRRPKGRTETKFQKTFFFFLFRVFWACDSERIVWHLANVPRLLSPLASSSWGFGLSLNAASPLAPSVPC